MIFFLRLLCNTGRTKQDTGQKEKAKKWRFKGWSQTLVDPTLVVTVSHRVDHPLPEQAGEDPAHRQASECLLPHLLPQLEASLAHSPGASGSWPE